MAITIEREEIKRKCMIPEAEAAHDAGIDALIAEMQPSIEYTIADEYLNDTENEKLQATLKLGALEIISGEFLQQLYRELGATETFKVGSVQIGARREQGARLIEQGESRLRPYRKTAPEMEAHAADIDSTTGTDRSFTSDSMRVW